MDRSIRTLRRIVLLAAALGVFFPSAMWANGGPFVVKYPGGDPAAKGVLARLDPGLKPARETRLEVVREDLSIRFERNLEKIRMAGEAERDAPPLVRVRAEYRIRNPLDEEVEVDFGFPILRGIYIDPRAMMPRPAVFVTADGKGVKTTVISNSVIYGVIRQRAREAIDRALESDSRLAGLFKKVANSSVPAADREPARGALADYLKEAMKWNDRDAALLVEYAGLNLDLGKKSRGFPILEIDYSLRDEELRKIVNENLGALGAIGEQKATQLLAHLAGLLDPRSASGYEEIFNAWGGDVRERAVDLVTGEIRPRELTLQPEPPGGAPDPGVTLYARVDYLDDNPALTASERTSLRAILKNLPVIFTFAPMNLLHYRVTFKPRGEQTVAVDYRQYAYLDSREPGSYQLAYVVHPASLWETFGPIRVQVEVPEGVEVKASIPCERTAPGERLRPEPEDRRAVYAATLSKKTGELFVAVDAASWKRAVADSAAKKVASP